MSAASGVRTLSSPPRRLSIPCSDSANIDSPLLSSSEVQIHHPTRCHAILYSINQALDSEAANLSSVATSVSSIFNAVFSTLPTYISKEERLTVVGGISCGIYAFSGAIAAAFLKEEWGESTKQRVAWLYTNAHIFSNNFNFAYDTLNRIVGEIFPGVYPHDTEIIVFSSFLAICLVYAWSAYKSNQIASTRRVSQIVQALSSTFAAGAFVSSIGRICKYFYNGLSSKTDTYIILGAQGVSLIAYCVRSYYEKQEDLKLATKRLSIFNNSLYDFGVLLETIEARNIPAEVLLGTVLGSRVGAGAIQFFCPRVLRPFRISTSESSSSPVTILNGN